MKPVPWKLWEGQVVDLSFPLRRYLGGTDQSAVYLTQYGDPEARHAAIKLVLVTAHDAELLSQWERAEQLSHAHLLRVVRWGSWQINQLLLHYVVTEYAEENLAEVLADRPLTPAEARKMLLPLLDALSYVHGRDLVYGHLKPSNLMAAGDQLKLSVDGISRVGDLAMSPAVPSAYDPPEFSARGCSPIGDVWSLGVTLVEMLTRRLPTLGPKGETVLPETLPSEFLPVVRACLQPDPKRRAPLADVMALLQPAVEEMAPPAEAEPPAASRKWLSVGLVSAAAVALAAILAVPRLVNTQNTAKQAVVQSAPASTAAKPELPPPAAADTAAAPQAISPAFATPERAAPAAGPPPAPKELTRRTEAKPELVVHQVLPDVTEKARRTIHGTVRIDVLAGVDTAGHVTSTKIESQNSRYFANLTLKAVEQWEFAAGASAGEWALRFELTTRDTQVHAARVGQ